MMNSRLIDHLDPEAREVCMAHIRGCRDLGIEIIVTSTWRDHESQAALYTIGRTAHPERRPVTNAKPGRSWHNFRLAWDVVPVISGKPVWDSNDPIWKEVIQIGRGCGAEAGAEWKSFVDMPHFQYRPKLIDGSLISLDEAESRFAEYGTIFV